MTYKQLLKRYSVLRFKTFMEYKASFMLGLLSSFISIIVTFLFWGTIYNYTNSINGWTFAQIIMLQGFFHLFLGLFWIIFHFSEHMDELIINGGLDKFLSKPINPLIAYMFQKIDWFEIMQVINAILYFWIAIQLGATIYWLNFIGAVAMILLGCTILALIMVSIGCSSFWVGRTNSIMTVWNSIWEVGGYPITIFPYPAQILLTFGMPIIFLQTYPSLLTMNQISWIFFMQIIITQLILIGIWFVISVYVWKKGLKRYSSYGG